MNGLRILLVRRVIVSLALAGLMLPLVPAASARAATTDRLTDALGHRDAVIVALAASQQAPDPTAAFLDAYYAASGQDTAEVLARLEGYALWMLAEPVVPFAVLVASGTASGALSAPSFGAAIATSPPPAIRHSTRLHSAPEAQVVSSTAPLAAQPRGP